MFTLLKDGRLRAPTGVALLVLAWAAHSPPVQGVDLRDVLTGYAIASWNVNDGAPEGSVYALAQDRDGYLWLGTDTGLHRFDGTRFRSWSSLSSFPIPAGPVQALYVSRDGSLWGGFGPTGGAFRVRGTDVRVFGAAEGLPAAAVNTILEDHAGTLWAGTDAGLFELSGERWSKVPSADTLPDAAVWGAHLDARGTMLLATAAGLFQRSAGGSRFTELERFPLSPGMLGNTGLEGFGSDGQTWTPRLSSDNVVRSIATDHAGRVLISDLRSGFRRLGPGRPVPSNHRGRGLQLLLDSRGAMWVATSGQGVWRVRGSPLGEESTVERITAATGLATEGAFSLLEDRNGNVWAGGSPSGLTRLTPQRFIPVPIDSSVTALTITGRGRVWVGTSDALVEMPTPMRDPLSQRRHLTGESIRALHVDAAGAVWVGTERDLLRMSAGSDRFARVISGAPLRQIDSIGPHPGGGVLIADVDQGLLRWTDRDGLRTVAFPDELTGMRVITTFSDSRGRVWLASAAGRIARLDETGRIRVFRSEEGFSAGPARVIHEDERGVIWFGGPDGITRYAQDRAATVRGDGRLPIRLIRGVTDDREGYLWIATTSGLLRIHHTEAEKAAADPAYRPLYALYDKSDGLAGLPRMRSDRTSIRTPDGSLWFVTGEGITIVPTDARTERVDPLRVGVEGVTIDDKSGAGVQGMEIAAGAHRLQIEYADLNLTSAHKTRFRFRLEGVDSDWVDAGTRRQASYTNLGSGSYRFRVAATDALGGWQESEQAWVFSIRPHFYETRWFMGTCGAAVLLVGWAGWTFRLRQERKRFSLVLTERARLSREIHDTLLQGLVGLVLQCDAIATDLDVASAATRNKLQRLRRQAQRYIKDARHAIWNLRSSSSDLELVEALKQFGAQAAGSSVEFGVSTHGVPRPLGAEVERELLRIAQEAIANAALHSRARRIDVAIRYSADGVTLSVADDGCGFKAPAVAGLDGHYGILSMRERADLIRADFQLDTRLGAGTRIEVSVPHPAGLTKVAV